MKLQFTKIDTKLPSFTVFDGMRNVTITEDMYETVKTIEGALPLDPKADISRVTIEDAEGKAGSVECPKALIAKNKKEKSSIVTYTYDRHPSIDENTWEKNKKYEIICNFNCSESESDGLFLEELLQQKMNEGINIYKIVLGAGASELPIHYRFDARQTVFNSVNTIEVESAMVLDRFSCEFPENLFLDKLVCNDTKENCLAALKNSYLPQFKSSTIYCNDGIIAPIDLSNLSKEELLAYKYDTDHTYIIKLSKDIDFNEVYDQISLNIPEKIKIAKVIVPEGFTSIPDLMCVESGDGVVYDLPSTLDPNAEYYIQDHQAYFNGTIKEFRKITNIFNNSELVVKCKDGICTTDYMPM